ncbi:MAG: hypothetical protein ACKV2T_24825 [Kofleriaceae bacterium]
MLGCKQCLTMLLVLASCGEEKKATPQPVEEAPPTFRTDRVECFVGPGVIGPGGRMDVGRRGPDLCQFMLSAFLEGNRTRHVVGIVPIEYPVPTSERTELREQGTQELLVTTADRGSWPSGGELEIMNSQCSDGGGDRPIRDEPRNCFGGLVEYAARLGKAPDLVVPLAGEGMDTNTMTTDPRPRTTTLLLLRRR